MAFDWTHYLDLADELAAPGAATLAEARSRSAVSRAYYSAYCTAVEVLKMANLPVVLNGPASHQAVQEAFKTQAKNANWRGAKEATLLQIGARLGSLHSERKKADYRAEVTVTAVDAATICMSAKNLLAKLAEVRDVVGAP